MWQIVFFIPPFVAMMWTLFQVRGKDYKELRGVLMLIMGLLFVSFSIESYIDQMGKFPFVGAKLLHDVAATTLVPLAYYIFSLLLHMKEGRSYFKVQMLCMLIMLPDVFAGALMLPSTSVQVRDASYNHLQLYLTENLQMVLQLYNVTILIQLGIVMWRLLNLRQMLKVRALVFSSFARSMLTSFFVMAGWVALTMFASHRLLSVPMYNAIFMTLYCVLVTICYLFIGVSVRKDLVLNSENEAVIISKDSDSQLAQDIQLILDRDKIYCRSDLRIDDLASMLMSNRTYVARIFRMKYNATFTEVMNRYRIDYAKKLMLDDPRRRLDEIAFESGFSSSSFFGKVFKAAEGKTPSQWRAEQLGQ